MRSGTGHGRPLASASSGHTVSRQRSYSSTIASQRARTSARASARDGDVPGASARPVARGAKAQVIITKATAIRMG
jgi:hypothetical protein